MPLPLMKPGTYLILAILAIVLGQPIFAMIVDWRWRKLGLYEALEAHDYSNEKWAVANAWALTLCAMICFLYLFNVYVLAFLFTIFSLDTPCKATFVATE